MTLFRTAAPAFEPVTLAEAKAHLRIGHDAEDELIGGLLRAAREETEARTGVGLLSQHWRLALDEVPQSGVIALERHPVRNVTAVTIYGADGEASLLGPDAYIVDAVSRPARLILREVPARLRSWNGFEADFECGYGEAGTDVPDILKRAILTLAAHWYEFRAAFSPDEQPVSVPDGFLRLISGHARKRL